MRERLTAAVVAITFLVLLGAGLVRSFAVSGELRQRESDVVASQARVVGQGIAEETARGGAVDADLLARYLVDDVELRYEQLGRPDLVLSGPDFEGGSGDPVSGTVVTDQGALTVTRTGGGPVGTLWGGSIPSTLGLLVLITLVAGIAGYAVARRLSAPFRQLAVAAGALSRGRLDLDLPQTRVPEAQAIAQALGSSAEQLRERLEREREFGLLASHVLRTPLTSLRLNLEELVEDPATRGSTRTTALACLTAVGRISEVAGELVEVSGRGVLLAGAAIPLRDLATQVAQRWSDRLEDEGRALTAAVDGDIDLLFTPGPVEQALDVVLEEAVRRRTGSVRLVFHGRPTTVSVDIGCEGADGTMGAPPTRLSEGATAVLAALGGQAEVPAGAPVLRLQLPRR